MNVDDFSEDAALRDLLGPPDLSRGVDPARELVLRQTTGVLRRRRWVRRGAYAWALIACYGAGLATTTLVSPEERSPVAATPEASLAVDVANSSSPDERPALDESEALPEQVRFTKSSFGFYRAAGDYQLLNRGNIPRAARLYARALELASPEELAISATSDNWLLLSLKQSRIQDTEHAHNEG